MPASQLVITPESLLWLDGQQNNEQHTSDDSTNTNRLGRGLAAVPDVLSYLDSFYTSVRMSPSLDAIRNTSVTASFIESLALPKFFSKSKFLGLTTICLLFDVFDIFNPVLSV
jgi:hypothetical protein